MIKKLNYKGALIKSGGYTVVFIPSSVLGSEGRVRLKGNINKCPIDLVANPWRNSDHILNIPPLVREKCKLSEDSEVELDCDIVNLDDTDGENEAYNKSQSADQEVNVSEHLASIPEKFTEALESNVYAKTNFNNLDDALKQEYVVYISEASDEYSQQRRIEDVMALLS
jgi:hypothetical protein